MTSLRPLRLSDCDELTSWFPSERDVVQWAGPALRFPFDEEQMKSLLSQGEMNPPQRLCWMAEEAGCPVGHAQLAFDWRNGNARVGRVAVNPSFRGRGIARSIVANVVDFALSNVEIERVDLQVYTWNAPAITTYENLGFVHEGVLRSSALVDGERWDTAIMSMLRKEWSNHAT